MLHYILSYLKYVYVNKELELKLKFLLYIICRNIYSILIVYTFSTIIWWRYQTETFSALLALCEGNSPVIGGYLQYHRLPVSNGNNKNSFPGTDRQQQTKYDNTTISVKEHMITTIAIWYDDDNDSDDDDDDDDDDYNILSIQLIQIVLHYDDNEMGQSANIRIRPSDHNVHYYSHTS